MIVMFMIHFTIYAPLNIFLFIKARDKDFDNPEHNWPYVITRAVAQTVVCGYGFYTFSVCFIFLKRFKEKNLNSQGLSLTGWNRFIVCWTVLIATMKLLHAIISIFIASIQRLWP